MSAPGIIYYYLYQQVWIGLDWLFPPICAGCGKKDTRWCSECQSRVVKLTSPLCEKCGQPQNDERVCIRCQTQPPTYAAIRSWAIFKGPVREALHHLKYKRDLALGDIFSRYLINILRASGWDIDLVVPVPLGIARQAERGYNQAALLARPVALGLSLNYKPSALRKVRDNRTQVGLTFEERRENVSDAYWAEVKHVQGKRVLIIDDVITSGATLDACAMALRAAGAQKVYGVTVARAE